MIRTLTLLMCLVSFVTSANNINEIEILEPVIIEEVVRNDELPSRGMGRGEYFTLTAYDSSYESCEKHPSDPAYRITSTGKRVREGFVAVDPDVIPYHSKVIIEGLGEFTAEDTGGDIVGNRIDVFMESRKDALEFGRQKRKVYIVK